MGANGGMADRRVVVTIIGLVSSLSISTEVNWRALLAGKSRIRRRLSLRHLCFCLEWREVKDF